MFYVLFFFKKQKMKDQKKAGWPKFCNIFLLLFLLKIGSVGPVDKQINLLLPYRAEL